MKVKYIFDAGSIALYFAGDERVKKFFDKVFNGESEGFVCELNIAEFYYKTAEKLGVEAAKLRCGMIRNSRIKQVSPGKEATEIAAKLKLKYKDTLSLADCYLIAEASLIGAKILTTDKAIKEIVGDRSTYFEIA